MKHLSTTAIGLSVAVVAAAAIAQTKPPETPTTSNASRKQSGTVGTSPDAAPVANPASHTQPAEPAAVTSPAAQTPAQAPALTPAPATTGTEHQAPAARSRPVAPAADAVDEDGHQAAAPARLPKRPDRN
ncbi:DNA segregation ATPase FtsK/SpoIIIE, S-DNA-T family [Roseateles sp. YR242]|uniref:hypothetical protein n=1 Tax=Roseateles sp. YR242 TaxID=1855305 RepID=UPI0008AE34EB|nr:hypothetical protein [Roseateles sp. YR242]SEL89089.1 DNA segregation ATPase FtsK/SpoIIIE, S-DNA-T family [Roseateles sp. YR242]